MRDELQQMAEQLVVATHTSDVVKAYDNYAVTAMRVLLQWPHLVDGTGVESYLNGGTPSAEKLAERAWQIADAMMAERKKRDLGELDDNNGG